MAYNRKYSNYRKYESKKKAGCTKYRKPYNVPKMIKTNTVFMKRHVYVNTIGTNVGTGWTAFPFQFKLDNLPAYSEFTSLFDAYRINGVKLTFTPFWDSNDVVNQGTVSNPRVYTVIDANGIPPGSVNTEAKMHEYSNMKIIYDPMKAFSIYIKNPSYELASTGTGNNAVTSNRDWLDTDNPSIPHNGAAVGMIIPVGTPTTGFYYNVIATYYLEFKTAL